jgi:hypothetical protein
MKSGFCDNGHSHYYYAGPICGGVGKKDNNSSSSASASASDALTSKKKLKLLKGLTKDLSKFSDIGFGLDSADALLHQVQGKLLSVRFFFSFSFSIFILDYFYKSLLDHIIICGLME